jgi:biopolymer transport protein ExbB
VNELALLWVAVPSVVPGAVNVIHVYGGNAAAAAEPAANVFDGAFITTLHFAESDGPAVDAAGTVKSQAPIMRQPNGLLGTSAKVVGEPITFAASDRLKVAADAPVTISFWIKPDAAVQGGLMQWGPLKLSLVGGQVVAESAKLKAGGGSVPPNTWAHVAVQSGGGKLTLFINGQRAAQADGSTPAIEGAIALGGGFAGLIDELQISNTLRGADWLRLTAAAQGADGKLVTSVKEASGDSDAGESKGYIGVLVKNLTTDAWVVIIILGIMFVLALWVMATKAVTVGRADRDNRNFLQRFRAATHDLLKLEEGAAHPNSSLFRLYRAGVRELTKREVAHDSAVRLSGASIDAVKAAVDADMVRETHRLNDRMVLLTIAISGGPFLGLLGTVVGVMITFAAIAAAGDVNVNAIAPGIAAALLATVAGLGVAIPALFGYNFLASRIKNISADMQIFVDEFVTRVAETYGQR